MKAKLSSWLPLILWMTIIFLFSNTPDLPSNKIYFLDFVFKKSAHMIEFGILTFLFYRAQGFKKLETSILLSWSYAFTDEIHQLFVPGRGGRLSDVFIVLLGIIIATKLIKKLKRWNIE